MRKLLYGLGGLAVVAVSFMATLWAIDRIYGSMCPAGGTELQRPFPKFGEPWGYSMPVGIPGDLPAQPSTSKLLLCEDGVAIGPARSGHAEIAKEGRGRYSHWGSGIMFSTSDNSDPNRNGRIYSIVNP
jgi:hypothetical protein